MIMSANLREAPARSRTTRCRVRSAVHSKISAYLSHCDPPAARDPELQPVGLRSRLEEGPPPDSLRLPVRGSLS